MSYAILRTGKLKTNADIASASGHNGRTFEVENADSNLANLNDLDDQSVPILQKWNDRIGDQKVRKNAVRGIELFMGFSPEAKDYIDPQEWKSKCQKFADNHFGEENILQVDLHMDEKTPHCQIILIPIDEKGKLNCRSYLGGKEKLIKLQDDFHEDVGMSFDLERGEKGSLKKHKPIKEYYHDLNQVSVELEHVENGWDIVTKHSVPEIKKPPLTGRNEYQESTQKEVDQHSKDIKNSVNHMVQATKKPLIEGASKAMEVPQLKEERKDLIAEKEKLRVQLKDERDKLRDIPLNDVMHTLGYQEGRVEGKETIYETPKGHISINDDEGLYSKNWDSSGGKGAINLVMEVNDCEFKEAVSWLKSEDFSQEQLTRSAMSHTRDWALKVTEQTDPVTIEDKIEKYAKKDDSKWDIGKKYLINRGINEDLIDQEYDSGTIWTNNFGALCFASMNKNCVHIRGTKGDYKQTIGKKSEPVQFIGTNWKGIGAPVILCESPIDALSVACVYDTFTTASCGGTIVPTGYSQYSQVSGGIYACAFDNDNAGRRGFQKVKEAYPKVKDWSVPEELGKDWNDAIMGWHLAKEDKEKRKAIEEWMNNPTMDILPSKEIQEDSVKVKKIKEEPKQDKGFEMGM